MEIFFGVVNSMDKFQVSMFALSVTMIIISIPFFKARYKSRQQWFEMHQNELNDRNLVIRLFTIGYAIRRFERYKAFQNLYIVIALYIAISGFFEVRHSLLAGNGFDYLDIALRVFSMLFPLAFYAHGAFLNSDIRSDYKKFKTALNVKSLTIPVLASTKLSTIEYLDANLFGWEK